MVLIGALGYLTNPLGLLLYLLCALLGLATLMCIARIGNQVGVYLNANPRINLILMLTAGILLMSSGFIFAGAKFSPPLVGGGEGRGRAPPKKPGNQSK